MHIKDSQLTLGSQHALEQSTLRTTTLERVCAAGERSPFGAVFEQELGKLREARLDEAMPIVPLPGFSAAERIHDMVETMLAMLFGSNSAASPAARDVLPEGAAAASLVGPPRARWQLTQTEQYSESEVCRFAARGKVCLADGSERQFDIGFQLERREEVSRTVSRTLLDPLVVDAAAPRAVLSNASVEFDLDSDGNVERMRLPGADSAILFLDRNHNGRADNGSELFGPETGNGFAELARLDGDRNGWIDEADAAFADLRLWQMDDAGQQQVRRLAEAGVGALATAAAETPFALKERGETIGQMRSSSVWLGETGGAGVIRQIDVGVTPVADAVIEPVAGARNAVS